MQFINRKKKYTKNNMKINKYTNKQIDKYIDNKLQHLHFGFEHKKSATSEESSFR